MVSARDVLRMLSSSSCTREGGATGVLCTIARERGRSSLLSPSRSRLQDDHHDTLLNDLWLRYECIDDHGVRVGALCGYETFTAVGKGGGGSSAALFVLLLSDVTLVGLEECDEEDNNDRGVHAPAAWIRIESKASSSSRSEEIIRIKPHDEAMGEALAQAISSLASGQGTMLNTDGDDGVVGAFSLSSHQHQRRPHAQTHHVTSSSSSSSLPRVRPQSQPTIAAYHTSTRRGQETPETSQLLREVISELSELRRTVARQEDTISRLVAVITAIESRSGTREVLSENVVIPHRFDDNDVIVEDKSEHNSEEGRGGERGHDGVVVGERGSASSGVRRPATRPHRRHAHHHVHHHVDPNDDGDDNEIFHATRVRFAPRPATAGGILRPTHELIAEDETEILRPPITATERRRSSCSDTSASSASDALASTNDDEDDRCPRVSGEENRNGERLGEEKEEGGDKMTCCPAATKRSIFSPRLTSIPSPPEWTHRTNPAGIHEYEENLEEEEEGEGVSLADRVIPSVATTISGRVVGRRERRAIEDEEALLTDYISGRGGTMRRAARGKGRRRRSDSRPVVGLGDLGEEAMSQIERLAVANKLIPDQTEKQHDENNKDSDSHNHEYLNNNNNNNATGTCNSEEDHSLLLLRAYRDINGSSSCSSSSSSSSESEER